MILDSSVIVAIALREPGYEDLVGKMREGVRLCASRRIPILGVGRAAMARQELRQDATSSTA